MKKLLAILCMATFGVLGLGFAPAAHAADGKQIFLKHKCNKCHEIKSQGIEPLKRKPNKTYVDLSDVGKRHTDAAWYPKWLHKEIKKDSVIKKGKQVKHKVKFKGSDDELKALVDWLLTLK